MIAGLILAAGESSRMGQDKALLLYRGRAFVETIIAKLRNAGISRIAVVLGHHAEAIRQAVDLTGVEVVVNRDYQRGQTSSLQAGLRALDGEDLEGIVLCLVDHPAFKAETVTALVGAFERTRAPVVMPVYLDQSGHPVLIARPLFKPLLALDSSQGANTVVYAWRQQTEMVEVRDPGVLVDVDDPEAYAKLV